MCCPPGRPQWERGAGDYRRRVADVRSTSHTGATTMTTTTCPSPALLADYALGRVSVDDLERFAAHVDQCPACQTRMDTMDGVDDTFVAKLRQPLPRDMASQDPELEALITQAEAIPLERVAKAEVAEGIMGVATSDGKPPATLGQYMLLSRCGQGGMGTVYKALHTRLKRLVAVKTLPAARLADPQAVARFQREMEAVGRLSHPNIVQALDANEVDGQHFLVTEFVDGVNLSQLVRSGGPLSVSDACEIVRQAALGLQHAHDHGLVHRDVKPSNLMLSSQGIVKLLDLGLARLRPEVPVEADMTTSGQIMGSADYMAPEQCLDARDVDASADTYSLGCTLFFLLAGRPPFAGRQFDTVGKKLLAHAQQTAPSIRELRPEVPTALATIVGRMLAKAPGGRYATMNEVVAAVTPFAAEANLRALLTRAQNNNGNGIDADAGVRGPLPAASARHGNGGRLVVAAGALILLVVALLGGPSTVRWLRTDERPAVADENRTAVVTSDSNEAKPASLTAMGLPGKPESGRDAGSQAASAYLAKAEIPGPARDAMLTVLRQHPGETRWSGRSESRLFAIAVKRLPTETIRQQAGPALLNFTHMLAVQELLKAKSLLDRYAESGLTDATTLRQAVVQAAGSLEVTGKVRGVQHQATTQGNFAVACVLADESALTAHLLQPVELGRVQAAYRDVMHVQARDLMQRSNWKDALLLWQHLHTRKLVSPQLYLDAARCFKELGQDNDVVRVLSEAISTIGSTASPEFLERAGDLAMTIQTEAGQKVAEQAYQAASEKLKEQVTQPDARAAENKD